MLAARMQVRRKALPPKFATTYAKLESVFVQQGQSSLSFSPQGAYLSDCHRIGRKTVLVREQRRIEILRAM